MRRNLQLAGLVLAFFTLTCSDRAPTGPGRSGATAFDLAPLFAHAPGDPLVPFDSVRVGLRRTTDDLLLLDTTLAVAGFAGTGDSARLTLDVEMERSTEDVIITIELTGAGATWYSGSMTATLIAGATVRPAALTLSYVGLGFDADSVRIQLPVTRLIGGQTRNVTAAVFVPGGVLSGVPVGFRVGNTAVASVVPLGINAGQLTGAVPVRDSTWLYAETPTHHRDSIRIVIVPPPAQLQKISGDLQTVVPGVPLPAPFVVRVLDGLGAGFAGATVSWTVTIGTAQLSAAMSISDDTGYASVIVTPAALDGVAVQATLVGVAGSPQTFTATGASGPAAVVVFSGAGQSATVGTAVSSPPAVRVTNAVSLPVQGVTVDFAVAAGGGSITGASAVTDANGVAAVGSWTLGTAAGPNALSATVAGLTPVSIAATATAGAAANLTVISGDGQTATAGASLPAPLVVGVTDGFGNGVPGVSITWTPTAGSATPAGNVTDAAGRAQTVWTLGTGATTQSLTAAAGSLAPVVFTATATFANPSILLALVGGNRVPVPGSRDLVISLTTPAPAGGVTVTVTSDNTSILTVGSPGTVFIGQGQSAGQIALNGIGQGTTIVRGNAPGFVEGTLDVTASVQVLSMPTTLNVAYGGSASLPLTISSPAPAGGTQVSLVSGDPGVVTVLTPTVTIPQGGTTANATVSGVLPGTATVTGSTANFGTAQSLVSSTANLNILEPSVSLTESFGTTITIRFESQGVAVAAPSPGITVALAASDPGCLAVPPTVTIPTGLVQTTATLTYGGSTPTQCGTTLTASASNIASDVVSVTVNPKPLITLNATAVGSGLQESASGSLAQAAPAGGMTIRLTSSDPAIVLVSPNATTPGSATIDVPVAQGGTFFSYYVQGVEAVTGSATVTATSAAYADGNMTAAVRAPALDIIFLPPSTTTLTANSAFAVRIGVINAQGSAFTAEQTIRAGGTDVTATVTTSDSAVGRLVTAAIPGGDTVTVVVPVGLSRSAGTVAAGGVAFDPVTAGSTTVAATIPGFVSLAAATQTVTVSAPAITLSATAVGSGLQESASGSLGAAAPSGGIMVHIASSDSTVALVSPNAATPGSASIDVPVGQGGTFFTYYVQGVEGTTGSVTITATSTSYSDGTMTLAVRAPALDIIFLPTTTTTLTANSPFSVRIGVINAQGSAFTAEQTIRAGGTAVTATLTTSDSAVGQLVTSTIPGGDTATVTVAAGQSRSPNTLALGGVAFDPLTAGSTTVVATIPGFVSLSAATQTVTVNAPAITLGAPAVGSGLQEGTSGSLGAAAPAGGVIVHIASSDSTVLLVSPNASTPGTGAIDVAVAQGGTFFTYYVQGVEGKTGSATITATIPAFTDGTTTIAVRQPALDIIFLPTTTTTLSANSPFAVRIGVINAQGSAFTAEQTIRAGGAGVTATLTSSAPAVGQLVDSAGRAGGVMTVPIAVGLSRSPGTVATGGVAFDPLTAGTTTVEATIPGFVSLAAATQIVTVNAPAITLNAVAVGSGLQESTSGSLGAPVPAGGMTVRITSSNPAVALVSPDAATPGAEFIDVFVAQGSSFFLYYVQGVERALGTVTVTATAPGYTDGTALITARDPALDIIFLSTSYSAGVANIVFAVRIGVVNAAGTAFTAEQAIRAGGTAVTATVTSSDSTVAQLVTSAIPGAGTVSVPIGPGLSRSPGTVAQGGVAFDPLASGVTSVRATIAQFIALAGATVLVTVTP